MNVGVTLGGGDSLLEQTKILQDKHITTSMPEILIQEENSINSVANRIILAQEPMEDNTPSLVQRDVVPEPLQRCVQETKTRERRLVFDTLKQKNKQVLDSYSDMKSFKNRLEKEIHKSKPDVDFSELRKSLDDDVHPKEISKGLLTTMLLHAGIELTSDQAKEIASRVCFVGKKHLASEMNAFKRDLTSKIIADGLPIGKKERKELEKQIKKLDLGEDPRDLSKDQLSTKLYNAGILPQQSAVSISKEMCEHTKVDQLPLLKSDLKSVHSFKNKLFHNLMNQRAKEGYTPSQEEVVALKEKIDALNLGSNPKKISAKKLGKILYDNGLARKKMSENVAKSTCKEYQAGLKDMNNQAMKLAITARNLNQLLETNPKDKDLKDINMQIISHLRGAFNNKAYQSLKECEDNPTIHFLHEINLAMYTETRLLSAYVSPDDGEPLLGDKLLEGHEDKTLGTAIQDVRDNAVQNRGLFSSHSCLKYIMNHFEQFWGAITSQKIGSHLGDFDPHGSLGNNSGVLYEETLNVNGYVGKGIDVRTPSPTIGKKISPEFRAALQAIQNQRVSESSGEEGYGRPNCWIYTNYQDITGKWNGENVRSVSIMQMNKDFPLAFKGITLSKDSAYFKDGIDQGEGEKLWESIDHESIFDTDSILDFVEDMKEKLTDAANFKLEDRTKDKGTKLYFPAKDEREVEEYKATLKEIAEQTGEFLKEVIGTNGYSGKNAWRIKAAAKEFAYAAIQKYMQAKELAALEKLGIHPVVITTSACKEDIDRGFSDHVKRMFMLGAGDESFLAKIVNLPALMARYRVILNDRIQPLIGVVNYVDRDVAKKHLDLATEKLQVSSLMAEPLI